MKVHLQHLTVLALTILASATLASASGISYTCDPSIPTAECTTLNTAIAGQYASTFSNANASIYITFGNTGLGSSSQYLNFVSYTSYLAALTADSSGDAVDTGALASLPGTEPAIFGGGNIEVTSALESALGLGPGAGATSSMGYCANPGGSGCYDGVITLATPAIVAGYGQGYYYGTGTQAGNQYNINTVVEHETDEILGTSSCVSTQGAVLSDGCGGTSASAVDLFRYQAPGTRVFESTAPGAYFSYDGGATNGANGATYNTLVNGEDYADFTQNCQFVQDATGCLGSTQYITTDGGAEVNILDAVGYNLNDQPAETPEPSTVSLFVTGLLGMAALLGRRRFIARTILSPHRGLNCLNEV
ncbi:MAG: NF038122 family metalloprotease [Terracidiphilus sp.]